MVSQINKDIQDILENLKKNVLGLVWDYKDILKENVKLNFSPKRCKHTCKASTIFYTVQANKNKQYL